MVQEAQVTVQFIRRRKMKKVIISKEKVEGISYEEVSIGYEGTSYE